jgi:nucleoside-diphosphate-sugar epimerase
VARSNYHLPGDGSNWVSRIHVEDLSAIVEHAVFSDLTGSFPVADDYPCMSREIAEFCAELLRVPFPASDDLESLHPTLRANRRVDGSAIRRLLGVSLRYPSYREGIPAAIG